MTETITDPFMVQFRGLFSGVLRWEQLDNLWKTVRNNTQKEWYLYAIGDAPPEQISSFIDVLKFVQEIDSLLRQEHKEDYCGVVYVDDFETPTMIKIFDPNNLGVSCGFSDNPPLPGWIMSLTAPINLSTALQPASRRRWWQRLFQ